MVLFRQMEPQIRYVKSSDGVSIAYASGGDGPPVVFVSECSADCT